MCKKVGQRKLKSNQKGDKKPKDSPKPKTPEQEVAYESKNETMASSP